MAAQIGGVRVAVDTAAMFASHPILADGWDFDDCGSLVDRQYRTEADLADFMVACEVAGRERLSDVLTWAGVGCVVALAYAFGHATGRQDRPTGP